MVSFIRTWLYGYKATKRTGRPFAADLFGMKAAELRTLLNCTDM